MTIDTKAVEERVAKATPGPWTVDEFADRVMAIDDGEGFILAEVDPVDATTGDASFIAHAREDIPALLSALKEKDAEIAGLREELDCLTPDGRKLTSALAIMKRATKEIIAEGLRCRGEQSYRDYQRFVQKTASTALNAARAALTAQEPKS